MNQNIGKRRSFIWVIQPLYERQDHGFMQFRAQGGGPTSPPLRAGVRVELEKFDPQLVAGRVSSPDLEPKVGLCGSLGRAEGKMYRASKCFCRGLLGN